jgi:hypothetical protein
LKDDSWDDYLLSHPAVAVSLLCGLIVGVAAAR